MSHSLLRRTCLALLLVFSFLLLASCAGGGDGQGIEIRPRGEIMVGGSVGSR